MIIINMEKARDIHRQRLRVAREPLFAALDIAYQRATETGADTSVIVAQKQSLRDVTSNPAIEMAQTTDELKAVWPI
jgi:hypothetical protein